MFPRNIYLHLNQLLEKLFREKQTSLKLKLAFGFHIVIIKAHRLRLCFLLLQIERELGLPQLRYVAKEQQKVVNTKLRVVTFILLLKTEVMGDLRKTSLTNRRLIFLFFFSFTETNSMD